MRLEDKTGLITGAANGIGAATARLASKEGARLVVTDLDERGGQALASEVGAEFVKHDVTDFPQWQQIVSGMHEKYGAIDFVIHCAGIEGSHQYSGENASLDDWDDVLRVNTTGSFYACRSVFPTLLEQGSGSVVLMASIAAEMATVTNVAYGASKAAVKHLARTYAAIGWKDGARVRCNAVQPGVIKTRMTDAILEQLAEHAGVSVAEMEQMEKSMLPFGVRGEPDDVAYLNIYLASDESKYVTGTSHRVDGGWSVMGVA